MRISRAVLPEPSWRNAIIVLLLASLFVPVIVGSGFFFPYVVPRNIYFRVVVELGVSALVLAVCFSGKTIDLRDEPIFWALLAFVGASLLSALFSPARMHSLFGDFERMGGVWALLHLLLFFLLLRTLRDEDWPWILNGVVVVGAIVGIAALVEHSQLVAAARAQGTSVSPVSGILGNGGLTAAYLMLVIGVAAYLATSSRRYAPLYAAAILLDLLAIIQTENRSSLVGLLASAVLAGALYSALSAKARYRFLVPTVTISLAVGLIGGVLLVKARPDSEIGRRLPTVVSRLTLENPRENGGNRAMQWRAEWEGFRERPLLGYGPENHNLVWSAHFDPGIYAVDTDIYDRAHNQFVEVLGTGGLAGIATFAAVWLAIALTMIRSYRSGRLSAASLAVLCGIQLAYAAYLMFWFFDLSSMMLWVLVAALIASRATVGSIVIEPANETKVPVTKPVLAMGVLAVLVAALVWEGYVPLRANRALARIDAPRASLESTLAEYDFLDRSQAPQTAHTPLIMSEFLASLRPQLPGIQRDPARRALVSRAIDETLDVFAREIRRDPLNDRLYTHQAGALMFAADFYGSPAYRKAAIDALHTAIDLSPRRVEQRLALASVYMGGNDYERAIVVLNDAVKSDPMLGEPRFRLASAYIGAGKRDSALIMLQSSLRHGYVGSPATYLAMGKRLELSGRSGSAAKLYSDYLETKYTEAVWDRHESIDRPIPSEDLAVAAHLPLLYVRSRESELAIKSAAALSAFDPSRTPIVDRFVSDVGARRRGNWIARTSLLPCSIERARRITRDSTAVDACGVFRTKL